MAGAQLSACINHCTNQYADADHPQTYPCQSCGSSQKRTFLHSAHLYIASFLWSAGRGNVSGLGRCMQLYHGHSYRLECFQGYEQIKENRRDSGGITQKLVKNKLQKQSKKTDKSKNSSHKDKYYSLTKRPHIVAIMQK